MPFKPKAEFVNVEPRKKGKKEEVPPTPIFQLYKERALANLETSIAEAKGRWGYASGTELVAATPRSKAKASMNWALHEIRRKKESEKVKIYVKCGSRRVKLFEDLGKANDKGLCYVVDCADAVDTLIELESMIKRMTKDSEDGRVFHETAIAVAKVKAKGKYNPATDLYE